MSGSPKYAPVRIDPARMAMLAAERARRIEERRRRAEERRQQAIARQRARIAAHEAARERRREDVLGDVAAVAARVEGAASLTDQQRVALRGRVAEAQRVAAGGGAALAAAHVRGIDQAIAVAEGRLAAGAATADRMADLEAVRAEIDTIDDRLRHDEPGARQVDRLVLAAREVVADARRFPAAHRALAERLAQHAGAVEEARALSDRAELEVGQTIASFDAAVDEAATAGIELAGHDDASRLRERVAADLAAGRSDSALRGAERLGHTVADMEAQIEVVLDQLQAAELIVAAAVKALPAVGFRVLEDSVTQSGANVAFEIARSDGAVIELMIEPADDGARLRYAGTASDYVIEHGPEGAVARCDITEDLLERFHDELDAEGVEAGELEWEGKPLRPSSRGARSDRAVSRTQSQG